MVCGIADPDTARILAEVRCREGRGGAREEEAELEAEHCAHPGLLRHGKGEGEGMAEGNGGVRRGSMQAEVQEGGGGRACPRKLGRSTVQWWPISRQWMKWL